jgi:hypothetical protein
VNDAPALLTADVAIAIGAGTDVAVEAGDVVLVRSDPRDVPRIIALSRASYRKMVQNLWWAAGYNVFAIPLAAGVLAGQGILLAPAFAAVLMRHPEPVPEHLDAVPCMPFVCTAFNGARGAGWCRVRVSGSGAPIGPRSRRAIMVLVSVRRRGRHHRVLLGTSALGSRPFGVSVASTTTINVVRSDQLRSDP